MIARHPRAFFVLLSCFIWGLFTHILAITNVIPFGDEAREFYGVVDANGIYIEQGRWMGLVLYKLDLFFSGRYVTANEAYNILSLFFIISIVVYLFTKLFGISDPIELCAICGYSMVCPAMLMHTKYQHMTMHSIPGLLLVSVGAYFICIGKRSLGTWLISVILIACGVGTYQCYFAVCASALCLYFLEWTIDSENNSIKCFLTHAMYYLSVLIVSLVLYLVINKFILTIYGTNMSGYASYSSWGVTTISGYFKRLITAYKHFFIPVESVAVMFPSRTKYYYMMALAIAIVGHLSDSIRSKKGIVVIQYVIIQSLFPLAINLMFILTEEHSVHSLHMWTYIILVIYIVLGGDRLVRTIFRENKDGYKEAPKNKLKTIVCRGLVFLVICIDLFLVRFDSECHTKTIVLVEECKSYYTSLVSRIQSTPGYEIDMPIMYINENHKLHTNSERQNTYAILSSSFHVLGLMDTYINDSRWKEQMCIWCGFDPEVVENPVLESELIDEDLPRYPADGSVFIRDGIVIVNF